jgi:hypothetical protein
MKIFMPSPDLRAAILCCGERFVDAGGGEGGEIPAHLKSARRRAVPHGAMDTPRKNKSVPEWLEPDTGVRARAHEHRERIDPDTAYWIGLTCQALSDAGPQGLSFTELVARTKLSALELERVLAVAVQGDYVRKAGDYYRPS